MTNKNILILIPNCNTLFYSLRRIYLFIHEFKIFLNCEKINKVKHVEKFGLNF